MTETFVTALIVLIPLLGYILLGLFGRVLKRVAGGIGTMLMVITTGLALFMAYKYFFVLGFSTGEYQAIMPLRFTWLEFSPGMEIEMGLLVDPISAMMLVVVTVVSLMVHVFSLGYMKGEERYATYFAHLSLFTFSMLGLVLSTNIFQIYIFWELVGVSSFLLIGFYYDRPSAVAASKKAFIVTRFADLGFLVGILILSFNAGTLDFATMIQRLTIAESTEFKTAVTSSFIGVSALTWGLALVFVGGAGKSAMFPLHVWLPDAMEGPTPVSALIHAATMVVAGVYLVARLFPIFNSSPPTLEMVTWVGAFSALFAAIVACTQTDIKRVLAYSTMSQIGFMMFALGVARNGGGEGLGFTASMFHLFTHAMFKALLFLCAGAIIHYVHSNDMTDMGGLRKYMPVTHASFLVGCLAISGVPFFSGFFSKEAILLAAYEHNKVIYWVALLTSGLTAFYMFRLYFRVFWNKPYHPHTQAHGEGTWSMMIPLIILSVGAISAGYIPFGEYVSADGKKLEMEFHLAFTLLPVGISLVGILVAMWLYRIENGKPDAMAASLGRFYKAAYRKFYIDEIYLFVTRKMLFNGVGKPAAWIDRNIVDGIMNVSGTVTLWVSERIKGLQSGKVQQYAIYFLAGVVVLVVYFLYLAK